MSSPDPNFPKVKSILEVNIKPRNPSHCIIHKISDTMRGQQANKPYMYKSCEATQSLLMIRKLQAKNLMTSTWKHYHTDRLLRFKKSCCNKHTVLLYFIFINTDCTALIFIKVGESSQNTDLICSVTLHLVSIDQLKWNKLYIAKQTLW